MNLKDSVRVPTQSASGGNVPEASNNPNTAPSRLPRFVVPQESWAGGFFSRLKSFLTDRPLQLPRSAGPGAFSQTTFGGGFFENFKEWLRPLPPSARGPINPRMEVAWKSWHTSVWENLRDAIAPRKLPPLKITSKPVKVRDIWSKDENFGLAQAMSLAVHLIVAALLVVPIIQKVLPPAEAKTKLEVVTIDISPYAAKLPPGKDKAGGGGGGGERMQTAPTKGRAPKFSWEQITPPMAVIRNPNPKLAADPTLLGPPELKIPSPPMANYGDPLAKMATNSGGPGGGGGIGTGCCGGIGSGEGGGLGPGSGGGTGGGAFRQGTGGVGEVQCAYCPLPAYSEEARKAKYQGVVVLQLIVTPDGRAINIQVIKGPGLGLEEKAIEAVRGWQFKPASGPNGKPVPVYAVIEVNFRLL
jgi:protein TonB